MANKVHEYIPGSWTFKRPTVIHVHRPKGSSVGVQLPRERSGYTYPAEPDMLGEVIIRGIVESV